MRHPIADLADRDLRQRELVPPDALADCHVLVIGVDAAARRAVLVLPRPRVQEVRLDPDRTKVVALAWSGLWLLVPGGENAQLAATHLAFQDAQRLVLQAAQDPMLVERSRRQTESVLDSFFAAMTWTVEIRWNG